MVIEIIIHDVGVTAAAAVAKRRICLARRRKGARARAIVCEVSRSAGGNPKPALGRAVILRSLTMRKYVVVAYGKSVAVVPAKREKLERVKQPQKYDAYSSSRRSFRFAVVSFFLF